MALVFKIATLTIRTLAKPMASRFEGAILNHPAARQRVISVAQLMHRLEVAITRGAEGRKGRVFVGDMTEEKAVELASRIVSEGFIYSIAAALVTWETARKARDDEAKAKKDAAAKRTIQELHERHLGAEQELRKNQQELRILMNSIDQRLSSLEEGLTVQKSRWSMF